MYQAAQKRNRNRGSASGMVKKSKLPKYASNIIKDYVDATAEGLHILEPCLVGTNVRYAHSDITTLPSISSVSEKTITTSSSYGSLNLKVFNSGSGFLSKEKFS